MEKRKYRTNKEEGKTSKTKQEIKLNILQTARWAEASWDTYRSHFTCFFPIFNLDILQTVQTDLISMLLYYNYGNFEVFFFLFSWPKAYGHHSLAIDGEVTGSEWPIVLTIYLLFFFFLLSKEFGFFPDTINNQLATNEWQTWNNIDMATQVNEAK